MDAIDRAQAKQKPGRVRIQLNRIGFWEHNRGGVGIAAYHVHEVAHDIVANKTMLARYGYFGKGIPHAFC